MRKTIEQLRQSIRGNLEAIEQYKRFANTYDSIRYLLDQNERYEAEMVSRPDQPICGTSPEYPRYSDTKGLRNRYPTRCHLCGYSLDVGQGYVTKDKTTGKWLGWC